MTDETWGKSAADIFDEYRPRLANFDTLKRWAGEMIVHMLCQGETEITIRRHIRKTVVQCGDDNAIVRMSAETIRKQVSAVVAVLQEKGDPMPRYVGAEPNARPKRVGTLTAEQFEEWANS